MDYKAVLLEDLDRGYSKSDLERLIGLPKNSLSGVLGGSKKLSKKSELKIEKWEASEKPNPLEFKYWNRENANPKTTVHVIKEVAKRMGKEAVSVNTQIEHKDILEIEARIAKIEELLTASPKYLPFNKRTELEKELNQLKFELQKPTK